MPRPNPPRRRPRQRRQNSAVVKVPEGQQPRSLETPPARSAKAAVAASGGPAPDPEVQWSRRSLAVMVAIVAGVELVINLIGYPSVPNGPTKPAIRDFAVALQPIPLVAACFVAMPIAKYLTGEKRYLRVVETAVVGVVTFFIWFFLVVAVGALIGTSSGPATGTSPSAPATPLPNTTVSPAPQTFTPAATPSPTPRSGGVTTVRVTPLSTESFVALVVVDIVSYALAVYIYPPLYRRFRMKRPPPRAAPAGKKR